MLKFILLFVMFSSQALGSIGTVTAAKSPGSLERETGEKLNSDLDVELEQNDKIETFRGAHRLTFIDDTIVDMTAQSVLVIDDYVYDPANNEGSLSLKAKLGTLRYASGKLAKNFRQNVKISTPTSNIGVRGTDFTMTVDELGGSTIILLPSCDVSGMCYTGEITVETDVGMVILNQAFQATRTSDLGKKPLAPVLLDIDPSMINNLLIVRRKSILEETDAVQQEVKTLLDIDLLAFDELDEDLLAAEEEFDELAIDWLDFDLLPDILEQVNAELVALLTRDALAGKTKGKKSGIDDRGIVLTVGETYWKWFRTDGDNTIEMTFNNEDNYTINVYQGQMEIYDYELGGSGGSDVTIYQSN
jgi:hypothetical protein